MTYRIMCAYHPCVIGDKAFDFALRLARQVDGELYVVSVFQPSEEERHSEPAALMRAATREFDGAFERLRMEAAKLARPAHFDISVGYPAVHVLSEAARLNIAHIVVGAENKRLAIGSAQHRIAVMAQCAVTLVK
jgi:nucleotide-binding universal stress UspA family protein